VVLDWVGVSVVDALSTPLLGLVRRYCQLHRILFGDGEKRSVLEVIDTVGTRNTGTILRDWPDAKYFDSPKLSVSRLKHLLRAKAVLCPGLLVSLDNQVSGETDTWQFADGLIEYLLESGRGWERVPGEPFKWGHECGNRGGGLGGDVAAGRRRAGAGILR